MKKQKGEERRRTDVNAGEKANEGVKPCGPDGCRSGEASAESGGEVNDAASGKCSCGDREQEEEGQEKAAMEEKIAALEEKLTKEKDDYIRLMAEFETFRRRTAEEKLEIVTSASSETIRGLLPVLDDCERAMELLQTSADEAAKEGTGLIYGKLMKYLKTKGLERIEAKGKKFDTDFHEAVAQLPVEDGKKGLVYDVVESGYTLGGKILRYAKVVVGV